MKNSHRLNVILKSFSAGMLLWTGSAVTAQADSFCGFERGLIGTKAVAFYPPYMFKTTHKLGEGPCELLAYDMPSDQGQASQASACLDFKRMPSIYVDQGIEQGMAPEGFEYFQLQIFDAMENWAQIELKTGVKKWVQSTSEYPLNLPYHHVEDTAPISIDHVNPTQGMIFTAPDLGEADPYFGSYNRETTNWWFDDKVPYSFFEHPFFRELARLDLFDPNHIEQEKMSVYGDLFEVNYKVKHIVKDEQGREWLQANEILSLSEHNFTTQLRQKLQRQNKTLTEEEWVKLTNILDGHIETKPLRTVYFPYREPSGTITMVMSFGSYCD